MADNKIDIVVRLIYRKDSLKNVIGDIDRLRVTSTLLNQTLGRLGRGIAAIGHQFKRAVGFYITFRIFSALYRGVDALTRAIPDLIRRGEEWAAVLDDIQDATGMTAEQVSKLAGVAKIVGISVEGLGRQMSLFSRAIVENEENVAKYGIKVRDANGEMKSSWEIFQSVRNAVSTYGKQLLSTSAVQTAFGRSGYQMLDLLLLSDRQFQRLAQAARRAGLFMNQAAIDGAEAFKRTKNYLDATITGLGSQIFGGVAPALNALIASITATIQKNMDQIVDFVSSAIVWIAGFISGFLGLEMKWRTISTAVQDFASSTNNAAKAQGMLRDATDETTDSTERNTRALERQIKAIDRQLDKLDRVEDRTRRRREHKALLGDIADARRELDKVRNETIFFGGMSAVEAELARQAQTADIIDAEKALADAKQDLRQWEKDQEIEAERDRLTRLRDALQERMNALAQGVKKAAGIMSRALQSVPKAVGNIKGEVLELSDKLKDVFGRGSGEGANFATFLRKIQTLFQGILDLLTQIAIKLGLIEWAPGRSGFKGGRGSDPRLIDPEHGDAWWRPDRAAPTASRPRRARPGSRDSVRAAHPAGHRPARTGHATGRACRTRHGPDVVATPPTSAIPRSTGLSVGTRRRPAQLQGPVRWRHRWRRLRVRQARARQPERWCPQRHGQRGARPAERGHRAGEDLPPLLRSVVRALQEPARDERRTGRRDRQHRHPRHRGDRHAGQQAGSAGELGVGPFQVR